MSKAVMLEPIGGGVEDYKYASIQYKWAYVIFPENYHLDFDLKDYRKVSYLGDVTLPCDNAFFNARNIEEIVLRNVPYNNTETILSMFENTSYYGTYTRALKRISFITNGQINTIKPANSRYAFSSQPKLKEINCVFDLSNINYYSDGYNFGGMFSGCSSLEEVRFVPNTILWMNTSYQIFNVSQVLSDDSLVSIANGLKAGSSAPNLRLLSTPYARCSTLMGFVNSDNLFEANDAGDTSLADFITDVKGWTLYL